jgi:hypothetical protein
MEVKGVLEHGSAHALASCVHLLVQAHMHACFCVRRARVRTSAHVRACACAMCVVQLACVCASCVNVHVCVCACAVCVFHV